MTTTLDYEQVTAFAKAVRRELSDLGPDVLDDLTDGLEADLADKLADGEPLGDAAEYAAELRAAAGVDPVTHQSALVRLKEDLANVRAGFASLAARPASAAVIDFLVTLRPLWWILRAWGIFLVLTGYGYARDALGAFLLVGLIAISVQWGRGKWLPWRWLRGALVVVSIVAVLAVPVAAGSLIAAVNYQNTVDPGDYVPTGLTSDGHPVTNIFAYGPDGEPLTGVQLFDQNGDALNVDSTGADTLRVWDNADGSETILVPSNGVSGGTGWNVYPLQQIPASAINPETGLIANWAKREQPSPPFASVQQLLGYEEPEPENDDE